MGHGDIIITNDEWPNGLAPPLLNRFNDKEN
jgi:hypothetical protein